MKIRKVTEKDILNIVILNRGLREHHKKIDSYYSDKNNADDIWAEYAEKCLKNENTAFYLAEEDGRSIGYIKGKIVERPPVYETTRIGEVASAFVIEEYRNKGVMQKLIEKLFEWFRSKNIKYVELNVDSRNEIGVKTWRNLGFEEFQLRMIARL